MAIGRTRHARGRLGIPYDEAMLATMAFFIVLAVFFVVMAIWGFGQSSGLRFL
jgi:hypothetical protein